MKKKMNNPQQHDHHHNHKICNNGFNDVAMLDEIQVHPSSSAGAAALASSSVVASSEDSSSSTRTSRNNTKKNRRSNNHNEDEDHQKMQNHHASTKGGEEQQDSTAMIQQQQQQKQQLLQPLPCTISSINAVRMGSPSPLSVGETSSSTTTTTTNTTTQHQHHQKGKIRPVFHVKDDYNEVWHSSRTTTSTTPKPTKAMLLDDSTRRTATMPKASSSSSSSAAPTAEAIISSTGGGSHTDTSSNKDSNHQDHDDTQIENSTSSSSLVVDDEIVDKILVERLNNLSMEEREQGIHELHGVADTLVDLPPEQLQLKLEELSKVCNALVEESEEDDIDDDGDNNHGNNDEQQQYHHHETLAYRIARDLNHDYVKSIHLLCLKADYYDVEKAAVRCVNFFTYKMELFGRGEILGRDVTLDDLDLEDLDGMNRGASQLIQERDRAGRGIIIVNTPKLDEGSFKTCFRNLFYVTMAALRDVEIQKHGVAMVLWTLGQTKTFKGRPAKFARSLYFIPVRVVAVHYCCNTDVMDKASKVLQEALESHHLCRYRNHTGTYQDCLYALMTFGIPKQSFPINKETGEDDLQFHHNWIQMMKSRESSTGDSFTSEAAAAGDVSSLRGTDLTNTLSTVDGVIAPDGMTSNLCASNVDQALLNGFGSTLSSAMVPTDTTASISSDTNTNKNIIIPGPMDILMGRGSHSRKSQGNIRFRMILSEYYDKYNSVSRRERMNVACQVLRQLRHHGCRFIKVSSQTNIINEDVVEPVQVLEECSADESIEKISHAFRNMRTASKKCNQKQPPQQGRKQPAERAAAEAMMGTTGGGSTTNKKRRNSPNSEYYDQFLGGNNQSGITPDATMMILLEQQHQQEAVSSALYPPAPPSTASSSFDDFGTMF